jgi:hypothetical protein
VKKLTIPLLLGASFALAPPAIADQIQVDTQGLLSDPTNLALAVSSR